MRSEAARDDSAEIRAALPVLRRGTGLPVVFGGAVRASGRLHYSELSGAGTDAIRGLVVQPGRGLGGQALTSARPAWVPDYLAAGGISHDYDEAVRAEGLKAIVAVPVVVEGQTRGVVLGGLRRSLALGERTVDAFARVADRAAGRIRARDEARRSALDLADARDAAAAGGAAAPPWAEVRALNAELRSLAGALGDSDLRDRLLDVCTRMDAAAAPPQSAPPPPPPATHLPRLRLGPETVKSYLRSAMRRLGVHTRTEAVAEARRRGLLP